MGKVNMAKVQSKQEELKKSSGGSNYNFDKLEDGKNVRRILPPKGDSDMFYSEGFVHFGLGADGKKMVACLDTFGKKCPVCEYLDSIKNSKDKADKELVQNAKKTKRIYINVLNRDSDDDEEKPMILPIGKMILKQVVDYICDPDYGDITDYEEGRDITITKSGKGLNTEYSVIVKPKTTVASEQYDEAELDELLPDLEAMFQELSEDELVAILAGEEYEGDSDDSGSDDDEELDYDEMELEDLQYECKQRGIPFKKTATKRQLIRLLIEDDEESETSDEDEENTDEGDGEDSSDDGDDDLMNSVKNAVHNRRKGK